MANNYEPVTGGCFCGAVRYEAEANLHEAYYCHCRSCQKLSGSPAVVAVLVKPGTLNFTQEEPKYFQTSPFAKEGFCPHCGSRLAYISPEHEDWNGISAGSLDHPERAMPCEHICVESQMPWYKLDDNLPRSRAEDYPELPEAWSKHGLSPDGEPL